MSSLPKHPHKLRSSPLLRSLWSHFPGNQPLSSDFINTIQTQAVLLVPTNSTKTGPLVAITELLLTKSMLLLPDFTLLNYRPLQCLSCWSSFLLIDGSIFAKASNSLHFHGTSLPSFSCFYFFTHPRLMISSLATLSSASTSSPWVATGTFTVSITQPPFGAREWKR